MSVLYFPRATRPVKPNYWKAYYLSVAKRAELAGIELRWSASESVWCGGKAINAYGCELDGKQFVMDFSDLLPLQVNPTQLNCPYFKWQYSWQREDHVKTPNVFPLTPVMDFDWEDYVRIRKEVTYDVDPEGFISNRQRERAGAAKRRAKVHDMLVKRYGDKVKIGFIDQQAWWRSHDGAMVAVHVPGARNDMLDRGQWELMGLGVCVISPLIHTTLARDFKLIPYVHYYPCKDDYSDLIKCVERVKENRDMAVNMGAAAEELFDYIAPPEKYWAYVKEVVDAWAY